MTLAQTYSWIFYAIGLSSQTSVATQDEISQVADGINHAVPTQKEMQHSISWLLTEGLIQKEGKSIQLTDFGKALMNKGLSKKKTTFEIWKKLTKELSKMGVDDKQKINPRNMST